MGQCRKINGAAYPELRLENSKAKANSIVTNEIKSHGPWLSIGIIHKGNLLLYRYYGLMDLDYDLPVTESTTYNPASVSKRITAFGLLILESQGKLQLGNSIGKYISNLPGNQKNITIGQLIHHTSDIPSTDTLKLFAKISYDDHWTFIDEIELR